MAGGFKFAIDFDSSQFKRGSDEAADSLEKLTQSLEEVERSDVSDAERGVKDIGDAASDSVRGVDDLAAATDTTADKADDLGRQFSDAFTKAGDDARTAGDSMGESLEGPITKSQDLGNEIRSSLGESMGEAAGQFADGGAQMEDIVDGVVEVASEAASGLPGPFGVAAQAIVASGAAVYGAWKKRLEDIAEEASAMYDDMLESGSEFLSEDFFQKKLQEFFDPMGDSYESNMDKIDLLGELGVPVDAAARALVGYGDLSDEVMGKLLAATGENNTALKLNSELFDTLGITSLDVMNGIIDDLEDSKKSTDTARRAVDNYRDSIEEIPRKKKTDVDVDDDGSVRKTQRDIDGIHGTDATVRVDADTYSARAAIQALSYERPVVDIDVRYRRSGGFYK